MTSIKKLKNLYCKFGTISFLIIVIFKGCKYYIFRKSLKHNPGWKSPIATELSQDIFGQKYRTIDAENPSLSIFKSEINNEQFDEDIYPLV